MTSSGIPEDVKHDEENDFEDKYDLTSTVFSSTLTCPEKKTTANLQPEQHRYLKQKPNMTRKNVLQNILILTNTENTVRTLK